MRSGSSGAVTVPAARRSTALTRAVSSRGRERLGDVVVGAELEPDDAVVLVAARGEHDHRNRRLGAEPPADLDAVDARAA